MRASDCPRCDGSGRELVMEDYWTADYYRCEVCGGTGISPQADLRQVDHDARAACRPAR